MMNTDYGTVGYDNLVNRAGDVGSIQLAAGQGTLAKGSVISTDGNLMTTGKTPSYILCDETETDDTDTVTGIVWKNGNFVKESLLVKTGYTLTDADIASLRDVNIIIESAK